VCRKVEEEEEEGKGEYFFVQGVMSSLKSQFAEDWIQCMKRHRRWHEQCSSFERDLTFKCDICRVRILRRSFVNCKEYRYLRVRICHYLVFL